MATEILDNELESLPMPTKYLTDYEKVQQQDLKKIEDLSENELPWLMRFQLRQARKKNRLGAILNSIIGFIEENVRIETKKHDYNAFRLKVIIGGIVVYNRIIRFKHT